MLLALLAVFQLITVTIATPLHKYPFVFLLDIGNEELDKTNTEQIRVSLPGGSLALRYPAVGYGDTIVHLRVSGIDFGTDLKANIVEGGPGFNFVVLTFIGNPDVPYDAVVSIQTLPDDPSVSKLQLKDVSDMNFDRSDPYRVDEDKNDSAEDTSDSEPQYIKRTNAELTQSSSNLQYNYAVNSVDSYNQNRNDLEENCDEKNDGNDKEVDETDDDDEDEEEGDEVDNEAVSENGPVSPEQVNGDQNVEIEDYSDDQSYAQPEQHSKVDNEEPVKVDTNLYSMYEALRPHLYTDNVVQSANEQDQQAQQSNKDYPEDQEEMDQMFNDEEVHNDWKYQDFNNNNNFDADDSSAVAY